MPDERPEAQRLILSEETIRQLLEEGGWPCDRINDDTWRTHFRGKNASFPFYVRIDPNRGFVTFAIVPFLRSPEDEARSNALYGRLLELNQVTLMAKFSIDEDLDVILSVEYPTQDLDKSEFDDALDVLSYYADKHYDELRAVCENPPKPANADGDGAAEAEETT
ncbi:MAG: YbjN domain-containing protein [Myxococcota bacterium]